MTMQELLRSKQRAFEAEYEKNKEVITEWQGAIEKFFDQLRHWLTNSDPDKILVVEDRVKDIYEPGLGRYRVPCLLIGAFGYSIWILPKARRTIRTATMEHSESPVPATGRVDITDEVRRYILYRFTTDGVDQWFIEGPDATALQPLTQQSFEAALMSYFR